VLGSAKLIEWLTDPGELGADPFCGTAAWGYVAVQMGRRWIAHATWAKLVWAALGPGTTAVLVAFGGGPTWGAAVARF
jgi:hypothetical protein